MVWSARFVPLSFKSRPLPQVVPRLVSGLALHLHRFAQAIVNNQYIDALFRSGLQEARTGNILVRGQRDPPVVCRILPELFDRLEGPVQARLRLDDVEVVAPGADERQVGPPAPVPLPALRAEGLR